MWILSFCHRFHFSALRCVIGSQHLHDDRVSFNTSCLHAIQCALSVLFEDVAGRLSEVTMVVGARSGFVALRADGTVLSWGSMTLGPDYGSCSAAVHLQFLP